MHAVTEPSTRRPPLRSWALMALLLTIATAAGMLLDAHVSLTSQAMVYVLAVVIAAYTLAWLPSVVCAVGAVVALNFFFVPPRWTFAVDGDENIVALLAMLFVAVSISHLAAALRRQTVTARINEARARQLQELSSTLADAGTPEEVLRLGQATLDMAFVGPNLLALQLPDGRLALPPHQTALGDGLRCCMQEAAVLGPGTGRWPGLDAWYLPLGTPGAMSGAACVQNVAAADHAGRAHAQGICALLAQTLWRLRLAASMLAAQIEADRQQIQSTFLAAISHDLRTPLAALMGAASSLQTQRDRLSPAEQDRLLASLVGEANYLSALTENTLQLVRLNNAAQPLARDWESMEEIVGTVLTRFRRSAPARKITVRLAAGLPLIRVDPVLVAQLITNLLDNAVKYSNGAIDLVVRAGPDAMQIAVKDRGTAISEDRYQAIFEPYARDDRSGQRGAGLGLALCRAIAQAHGGNLTLRQRSGGGNSFSFSLPLEPVPAAQELP